jgi:hypothetical protein
VQNPRMIPNGSHGPVMQFNRDGARRPAPSRRMRYAEWLRKSLAGKNQILPFPAPAERMSLYFACATALFFFGYYADLGIAVGQGGTIPMVSAMPGLVMLLIYPGVLSPRMVRFIVAPMLFVVSMTVFAPSLRELLINRLLGIGQTGYSALMGYVASWALARCGRARLHKFLSRAIPIFLVLLVIEVLLPPMHSLMQAWIDLYGFDTDFEALGNRDMSMGGYRPTFFTSETSYVSTAAMLMLIGYVWTGIGVKRYIKAAIYLVLAAGIIRSPIVILAFPVIFASVFTDATLGRARSIYVFWMTIIALVAVSLIALLAVGLIGERLSQVSNGTDYSTTYRTYGAVAVAFAVLHRYPLFGAGVGSLKPVKDIIIATYIGLGVPIVAVDATWNMSINNAYATVPLMFGLVGSAVISVALWRLFKSDVPRAKIPVILAFGVYCITFGGVYTPKFVITFCAILTVAKFRPAMATIPAVLRRRGQRQALGPIRHGQTAK